ncbi:unnamed protein product [Caenorhabditis bovis]|uniref:ZP domain-containing protein n=1 Tax=Caenorhabditis bovis TaxID=2654633 RepID=A0A8S1F103_9PELO|nr:unnamed protein product [Caenorhabditis bovis]
MSFKSISVFVVILGVQSTSTIDLFPASDIIELPVGRFPEPDCEYSVRHRSRDGPRVTGKVDIGDLLYHSWKCQYKSQKNYLFCIIIGSCTISDGSQSGEERKIKIIDDDGCSVFPTILPDVEYIGDLSAGIKVHAFSLDVDTTAVHFTCNVRMVFKENGHCQRPKCPIKK